VAAWRRTFLAPKKLLDDSNIVYADRQIEQAYSLKREMEKHRFTYADL